MLYFGNFPCDVVGKDLCRESYRSLCKKSFSIRSCKFRTYKHRLIMFIIRLSTQGFAFGEPSVFSHSKFFHTKGTFVVMRFCLNSCSCSLNLLLELFSALKVSVAINIISIFIVTYDYARIYYMYSYV